MNINCASENSDADVISSNSCPISRPKMSNFFNLTIINKWYQYFQITCAEVFETFSSCE